LGVPHLSSDISNPRVHSYNLALEVTLKKPAYAGFFSFKFYDVFFHGGNRGSLFQTLTLGVPYLNLAFSPICHKKTSN